MQNIEVKVRCPDLERIRRLAEQLGAAREWISRQTDTYFRVRLGRLKLRVSGRSGNGTLISYSRPDDESSRVSQYRLLAVDEPDTLRRMLGDTLGVLVTVRKTRELYIYGRTRVHLDEVEGLGSFVELETALSDQSGVDAWAEHRHVRKGLELDSNEAVPVSYSDLMFRRQAESQ